MSEFPRYESSPFYEEEGLKYRLRDIKRDANTGISFEVVSPSVRGEVSFRIQDFNVFAFENTNSPQIIFESNMTPEQKRLLVKAIRDGVICETFLESSGERRKVYLPNLNHPSVNEARSSLSNDNVNDSKTQKEIAVEFILSNGVTFQIRGSEISNATYNGRTRDFTIE